MLRWLAIFVFGVVAVSGCSDDDGPAKNLDSQVILTDSYAAQVKQACEDLFDGIVDAFVRCGAEEKQTRDELGSVIDCDAVIGIADEESLRSDCLPTLKTFACQDLADSKLPSSCIGQVYDPGKVHDAGPDVSTDSGVDGGA